MCAEPDEVKVDARRAYGYLLRICRLGSRVSGSRGMLEQQKLIVEHFTKLGGRVEFQPFDARRPATRQSVRLQNTIVRWHPDANQRVFFACHYDTRPFPDRDRYNPRGEFVGANDGASGVALLMELGHHMRNVTIAGGYGVDFVFFDGEEFVLSDRDKYFLGSEYFATQYRDRPPEHRYVYGILLDMIGDRHLNLYFERNSMRYARELTESVWETARRLGVREFVPQLRFEVSDDHLPLNQIAQIPTCDIIDFDYPYWHTTRDTATACSGASLAKVGRVLLAWLGDVPPPTQPQ